MRHTYIISTQWDHYPFKGGYQRTVCRETQKTAAEAEQKRDGKREEGDIKRHCSKAQMQYGMDGGVRERSIYTHFKWKTGRGEMMRRHLSGLILSSALLFIFLTLQLIKTILVYFPIGSRNDKKFIFLKN